jgi:hypothetical protein
MKMHISGKVLLLMAVCALLNSCLLVPDSGEDQGTEVEIVPVPGEVPDSNTYVCNPMDEVDESIRASGHGVRGMLYYLEPSQPRYTSVDDYFTYGTFAQAISRVTNEPTEISLYFNQIYIPTRPFDRGFTTEAGQTLMTPQGDTLYEYFAVRHEGRLQLGSKTPGLYQMAILSDDGAKLHMDFGGGYQNVVNNDGQHPTRMGCAVMPVQLGADDKIPFVLDYNQGPRFHISLILMWRPWPDSPSSPGTPATLAEAQDAFCGVQGNSFYFDSTQNPPTPSANYNALLSRGWEVVENENYLLPEENEVNPCNEPAPVVSNFRVVTISSTGFILAWDTDRPATSQVNYRLSSGVTETLTPSDGLYYTNHRVTVTGLSPNTDYVVKGISSSVSGLTTESAARTLRTRR